jgi:hypothetical protein
VWGEMAMAAATATVVGAELPSGSRSERSLGTGGRGVMSARVAGRRAAASSGTSSSACSCSRSSSPTWSRTAPYTGEMAAALLALVDSGTIRVIDILILTKNEDGVVEATELADVGELGELQALEAQLAD